MIPRQSLLFGATLLLAASAGLLAAEKPAQPVAGPVSYFRDIRPIFQSNCQGCHQPAKPLGEYVMTGFEGLIKGGESGKPAIVPGKPDDSYLIAQITPADGKAEMPREKEPLSQTQIDLVRRWIADGAPDDTPLTVRRAIDPDHPPVYEAQPVLTSVHFSPDETLLAVSGYHEVLLYKADGSQLVARLVGQSERIESAVFSPDGKWLAVTGGSPGRLGEVQVWEIATHDLKLAVPVTYDTVYGASWSGDSSKIALGCADNTVRIIDAASGKQVLYQGAHSDWVLDTVFSKDATYLLSVSRDRSLKLIEVATQRFVDNITSITPGALKGGLEAVDRHPQKDELLIGGADGVPKIYKMIRTQARVIGDDFNLIKAYQAMPGRIYDVAFNADGSRFAVGSSLDGTGEVRIYETESDKLLKLEGQQGAVYAVSFAPSGKVLASAGFDGLVRLNDAATGKLVHQFSPAPIGAAQVAQQAGPAPSVAAAPEPPKPAASKETLPAGVALARIEARPKMIELATHYAYAQVLLTGYLAGGEQIDLTRMAEAAFPAELVTVSPTGLVRPRADGMGQITFQINGQSIAVPVVVSGQKADYAVSFVRDVMPSLSKLGCNAGTCHGSLNGKNGFKLSLRGYDPLYDHRALTDEIAGRRFNRAAPDLSLMLLKPSGAIPHQGGVVMQPSEPRYDMLRAWIAGGVKLDLDATRVAKIELSPKNPLIPAPGVKQQMAVLATFGDGSVRDITLEAFIESGNTEVAEANRLGLLTMVRRGEAPVLARYEGAYSATTVTVMGDRSGFEWTNPPANNYVDELVYSKLQRVKTLPSQLSSDDEFLRRVSLDLVGLPPTPEEVRAFMADSRDTQVKRDELIDRLVGGGDYVEHWTNKWGDLLMVNRKFLGEPGAFALRGWLKQAIASNMPYDRFVSAVLTASGSTLENPPAAYYKVLRTPEDTMENTTQLFLAVRFNCNKCHDHPFERWTQGQYYHLAAYFAQVGRKADPEAAGQMIGGTDVEGGKPLVEDIFDTGAGEVNHAATGKVATPSFPYEHADASAAGATRREQLARWITSKDNPYFARSAVNRLWGYLFGKGIIDPIDDIRAGNPPTNPELLDRLTQEFVASGFDLQHMLRTICKSRAYQASIVTNKWNQDDEINFSHAIARRLPAEVLYDAIGRATGSESHLPGLPSGYRAAQLPDAGATLPSGFFELFGRPARESSCECERSSGMMLGPVMTLVNGPTIAEAIADPSNAITRLVASEPDDAKLVEQLFVRCLCRAPTPAETQNALQALQGSDEDQVKLVAQVADYEKQLDVRQAQWEQSLGSGSVVWTPLVPVEMKSAGGTTFATQPDGVVLVEGVNSKGAYTIVANSEAALITGIRLEALSDPKLPSQGPGRAPNGNFVLSELKLSATAKSDPGKSMPVVLQNGSADFSQEGFQANMAIDGNPGTGWAVHPETGKNHAAVFEVRDRLELVGGILLSFVFDQQYADGQHQLGKFRLSVTSSPAPLGTQSLPAGVAAALAVAADQRTPEQKAELTRHFRSLDGKWVALNQELQKVGGQSGNKRLLGAQDLAWALINSPAFLFNR